MGQPCNHHDLPPWALKLALRAAQIVNESEPGKELSFTVIKHPDGRIEMTAPPRPELLAPAETAVN